MRLCKKHLVILGSLWFALILSSCDQAHSPSLPSLEVAATRYGKEQEVRLNGNVLEVFATIPNSHLRGGSLWLKAGPYFFVFSSATKEMFDTYDGLAAVRVVTRNESSEELARAMITRDALTAGRFEHGMRRAALAQAKGTEKPGIVRDLVHWSEDHVTEYHYPGLE